MGAGVRAEAPRRKPKQERRWDLLWFVGPALLIYGLYTVYPIFSTLYYSLFQWSGISENKAFVGLANYAALLADAVFWRTLGNNLILVFASVFTQIPLGLVMALLLFAPIRGIRLLRTVYFLPMLMSTVALGILWTYIYDPTTGVLNGFLAGIGLERWQRAWLGEPATAFASVIATIAWQFAPFYMILLRAAIIGIPAEIYESARIDGCSGWNRFRRITLPLILPTIITSAVLSVIGSLKYFDLIYVMTEGGPGHSTELMATNMYKQAFVQFNMGYASTIAVAMFAIAFIAAAAILATDRSRRGAAS
jgi:raffinose/stachyose/melibiose transport system permease protein